MPLTLAIAVSYTVIQAKHPSLAMSLSQTHVIEITKRLAKGSLYNFIMPRVFCFSHQSVTNDWHPM